MKFALYILVAFVFAFAAALPQDVSEYQHVSSGMDRLDVSKIEDSKYSNKFEERKYKIIQACMHTYNREI